MKNNEIESLLLAEMEEVIGGSMGTCVCENGGAGETVVIIQVHDGYLGKWSVYSLRDALW